jgi:hypothetical protein
MIRVEMEAMEHPAIYERLKHAEQAKEESRQGQTPSNVSGLVTSLKTKTTAADAWDCFVSGSREENGARRKMGVWLRHDGPRQAGLSPFARLRAQRRRWLPDVMPSGPTAWEGSGPSGQSKEKRSSSFFFYYFKYNLNKFLKSFSFCNKNQST